MASKKDSQSAPETPSRPASGMGRYPELAAFARRVVDSAQLLLGAIVAIGGIRALIGTLGKLNIGQVAPAPQWQQPATEITGAISPLSGFVLPIVAIAIGLLITKFPAQRLGLVRPSGRAGLITLFGIWLGTFLIWQFLFQSTGNAPIGWLGFWMLLGSLLFGSRRTPNAESEGRWKILRLPCRLLVVILAILAIDAWLFNGLVRTRNTAGQFSGDLRKPVNTLDWSRENILYKDNQAVRNIGNGGGFGWDDQAEDWVIRTATIPATKERIPHRRRILVIGDSFAWGDGYSNINNVWWSQLERELRRRGHDRVEVIGAGACGASTRDQIARADGLVETYDPDLVIWGFCHNDPDEKIVEHSDITQGTIVSADPWMIRFGNLVENKVFPLASWELQQKRRKRIIRGANHWNGYLEWLDKIYDPEGASWASYLETLTEVGEHMERISNPRKRVVWVDDGEALNASGEPSGTRTEEIKPGIPSFFLFIAGEPRGFDGSVDKRPAKQVLLTTEMDRLGIAHVDSQPLLDARYSGLAPIEFWVNAANGHSSVLGTSCWAVVAADYLAEHHADLLGEPTPPSSRKLRHLVNDWLPANMTVERHLGARTLDLILDGSPELYPTLPFGQSHIRLHLTDATSLSAIRLSSPWLEKAEVWVRAQIPVDANGKNAEFREANRWQKIGKSIHNKPFVFRFDEHPNAAYITEIAILPKFTYAFEPTTDQSVYNPPLNRLKVAFESAESGWYPDP